MIKRIDAKSLGLPPRTVIEELSLGRVALVMDRKSRIIMADGKKIIEKAEKIRRKKPGSQIFFKSTAPLCSKTASYLEEQGITILPYP